MKRAVSKLKAAIAGDTTDRACEEVGGIDREANTIWNNHLYGDNLDPAQWANPEVSAARLAGREAGERELRIAARVSRSRLTALAHKERLFVKGELSSNEFLAWYAGTFGMQIEPDCWKSLTDRRAFHQFDEAPKIAYTGPSKKDVGTTIFVAISIAANKGEVYGRGYTIDQMSKDADEITERLFKQSEIPT